MSSELSARLNLHVRSSCCPLKPAPPLLVLPRSGATSSCATSSMPQAATPRCWPSLASGGARLLGLHRLGPLPAKLAGGAAVCTSHLGVPGDVLSGYLHPCRPRLGLRRWPSACPAPHSCLAFHSRAGWCWMRRSWWPTRLQWQQLWPPRCGAATLGSSPAREPWVPRVLGAGPPGGCMAICNDAAGKCAVRSWRAACLTGCP